LKERKREREKERKREREKERKREREKERKREREWTTFSSTVDPLGGVSC
jgi:hypothetical protein